MSIVNRSQNNSESDQKVGAFPDGLRRMVRSRESVVTAILLLFCAAAELGVLFVFGASGLPAKLMGDEPGYDQLAVNLLEHSQFSWQKGPPLDPSVSRTPGYPLFLAFVYWIGGRSGVTVLIAQFTLLAAAGWALFILAWHFVSVRSAAIAGLLCVTSPQLAFMATYRMTEVLSAFLVILFALVSMRCVSVLSWQKVYAFITGATAGIAALVRPSFVLLIAFPAAALAIKLWAKGFGKMVSAIAALAVGFCIMVMPWILRNYIVTQRFIPLSADSGLSLYVSAQQYTGELNCLLSGEDWEKTLIETNARWQLYRSLQPARGIAQNTYSQLECNASYTDDALQKWRSLSIGRIVSRIPCRIIAFWGIGQSYLRRLHKLAWLHHGMMMLLAFPGIYLCKGELKKRHWPLLMVPLYLTLLHLVFHVEQRYSFPARPFIMIYAGAAANWLLFHLLPGPARHYRE
jgi:4-amino-4-deoxy-L-arabinose transferase-like glycosyltransferase